MDTVWIMLYRKGERGNLHYEVYADEQRAQQQASEYRYLGYHAWVESNQVRN